MTTPISVAVAQQELAVIKVQIVAARRSGNDSLAADLSLQKEQVKKRVRPHCVDCGVTIYKGERCRMHSNIHRNYSHSLPQPIVSLVT